MNGLLLTAKENSLKLQMIYINEKGVLSERFITVRDFNETYIRAYCHWKKQTRIFKRNNILSIGLPKPKVG
jgi:predicted DNA-binding transcriptional regulator YafY